MPNIPRPLTAVALLSTVLLLVGCGNDVTDQSASSTTATPTTIVVVVTSVVTVPDTRAPTTVRPTQGDRRTRIEERRDIGGAVLRRHPADRPGPVAAAPGHQRRRSALQLPTEEANGVRNSQRNEGTKPRLPNGPQSSSREGRT